MDKKILSQKIGDNFLVVDSEAEQTFMVSKEEHENLLEELGSASRRSVLKAMGAAALATPVIATGLLPTPAAASSAGVTISMSTVANQDVDATVNNPLTGPSPLMITATAATIDVVAPTPATGSFSLSAVTPIVPPTINVVPGGSQLFEFSIVNNAVTPPGNYLIGFTFTITTPTGTCFETEAVNFTAP